MKVQCAHTEMVDIDLLVMNPLNPNKHGEKQIELLAKIMNHQGWRHPVTVSKRSGFVVAGHGRIMAARKNGWTQVPVDRQDFATEADEYAHLIADNKISELAEHDDAMMFESLKAFPDMDLDLLGIPDLVIPEVEMLPMGDPDAVPEVPSEARTKLGDVYRLGEHRLMCGDSTSTDAVETLFAGAKAELCFTSPPYSDQREYNGEKDLSTEYLATFIRTAYGRSKYLVVNLGYSRKNGEVNQYWDDYIKEAKACGLKLLSWNIWDKGECGSIGNQTAMFGISHEWIFVFGTEPKALNRTIPNKNAGYFSDHNSTRQSDGSVKKGANRTVGEFSQLKTVYECSAQKARDNIDHPARFAVEFAEGYYEAMTDPGNVVYEPFGGSGTSLIAAEKTGRICRIMELDPKYCDVIVKRWEDFTGKKAELVQS